MSEAEANQRGYLITEKPEYLSLYKNMNTDVQKSLENLKNIYSLMNNLEAKKIQELLVDSVALKFKEMDEILKNFHENRMYANSINDLSEPKNLTLSENDLGEMKKIKEYVENLFNQENVRIIHGRYVIFDTLFLNRIGVATLTFASLLILILFLKQGRIMLLQNKQQQNHLQSERDRLEKEVFNRTAELTELARYLENVRENEKANLARELHDELGALLTTAKLDVARIRPKLNTVAPELMPRLIHLTESLNDGISLKRRIIEDLRPSTLSNLGLRPALEILCTEFSERLNIPIVKNIIDIKLLPSTELTIFRIVQESLNNIAKYAKATRLEINLSCDMKMVSILIEDNGVGFDMIDIHKVTYAKHGLLGIRYRVEAEKGTLKIESQPGKGTRLQAVFPFSQSEAKPESVESL
jgi:signal transduction histidine kinase